jgi:hypothetical protein
VTGPSSTACDEFGHSFKPAQSAMADCYCGELHAELNPFGTEVIVSSGGVEIYRVPVRTPPNFDAGDTLNIVPPQHKSMWEVS